MAIYIVTPLMPNSSALDESIIQKIIDPADRYRLQAERGWLVAFNGTSVELSNHIGLTGQKTEDPEALWSAIIVPITSYYGRGPSDMWEWLKTRIEHER